MVALVWKYPDQALWVLRSIEAGGMWPIRTTRRTTRRKTTRRARRRRRRMTRRVRSMDIYSAKLSPGTLGRGGHHHGGPETQVEIQEKEDLRGCNLM